MIELDNDEYVALCPEFDIASQGATIEEARSNLIEALTIFFETADHDKIQLRGRSRVLLGKLRTLSGFEVCELGKVQGFSKFAAEQAKQATPKAF